MLAIDFDIGNVVLKNRGDVDLSKRHVSKDGRQDGDVIGSLCSAMLKVMKKYGPRAEV